MTMVMMSSPPPLPLPSTLQIQQSDRGDGGGGGLDEPEIKKVKVSHFQYLMENLKSGGGNNLNTAMSYTNSSIFMVHKKLEERIGGILCCTVCLGKFIFILFIFF
jgi:hypothetical protein